MEISIDDLNGNPLPPRPAFLLRLEQSDGSTDDLAIKALSAGKIVIVGGVSLIDEPMYVVPIISVLQIPVGGTLRGWSIAIGHPRKTLGFEFFDAETELSELPFPTLMTYFVGQTEQADLITEAACQDDLLALTRFVLPFISDEGPPKDIDW
jgi:hypothetical protein